VTASDAGAEAIAGAGDLLPQIQRTNLGAHLTITHRYIGFALASCWRRPASLRLTPSPPAPSRRSSLTTASSSRSRQRRQGSPVHRTERRAARQSLYTRDGSTNPRSSSARVSLPGAKPQDIAAISGLVRDANRSRAEGARVHRSSTSPPPTSSTYDRRSPPPDPEEEAVIDGLYAGRLCRGHRPQGDADFTRIRRVDLALQTEAQDSLTGDVLAASVLQRGKSAGADKQLSFDVLVKLRTRSASGWRADSTMPRCADQRIDCTDPAAREQRPR